MNRSRRVATIALLISVVALGCHNWRAAGAIFRKPEAGPYARLNLGAPRALLTEGLERTRPALAAR